MPVSLFPFPLYEPWQKESVGAPPQAPDKNLRGGHHASHSGADKIRGNVSLFDFTLLCLNSIV
jgi:hypothetical protein